MPDPEALLTFTPENPVPVVDGVLYVVTGPVLPRGRVQLTDGDGRVRGVSPEFSQRNKLGSPGDAEAFVISDTGDPEGGDFTLSVYDQLGHVEHGESDAIPYDYADDDVQEALEALLGEGNVAVSEGVITFGGDLPIKGVTIRVNSEGLTGGDEPAIVITRSSVEQLGRPVEAGGPYYWGPVYIPANTSIVADLVATADDDDLGVYEGDSLIDDPITVYDYGDL